MLRSMQSMDALCLRNCTHHVQYIWTWHNPPWSITFGTCMESMEVPFGRKPRAGRLAYTQVQAVRENALLWCLHICNDGLSAVPLMIVLIISGIGCS